MSSQVGVELVLVHFKDDGVRRDYRVKGDRCIIGRKDSCDLQLPIPTVSREHCEILLTDGEVRVRDLGSSNGTYRNGARIEAEVSFEPGDRLSLGGVTLTMQIDGVPAHVEPPLLDAPTGTDRRPGAASSSMPITPHSASPADSGSSILPSAQLDPDDSGADLSDLLDRANKAVSDDSSVFDFDIDLDEDDKKA